MKSVKVSKMIRDKELSIEVGGLARQADGAALVRYGDTVVLVTVISAKGRDDIDFFPLFVDYREKPYAVGRVPGGFFKREGRPTTEEILTMRLTDRPLRPLFPEGYRNEVQIQAMVLSSDRQNQPDILTLIGASVALSISKIPVLGPIGAVRVGKVDGKMVALPTYAESLEAKFDIVAAGKENMLLMVEGFTDEVSESDIIDALAFAQDIIKETLELQQELFKKLDLPEKDVHTNVDHSDLRKEMESALGSDLVEALATDGKHAGADAVKALKDKMMEQFGGGEDLDIFAAKALQKVVKGQFKVLEKAAIRKRIAEGKRFDGRPLDKVRDIDIMVGLLPRTHGSAVFTRGETQALVVLTLGTMDDEQRVDGLVEDYKKNFLLHYNFPPFSVGEVRPIRGPGRREIGHGMLAERSLKHLLPLWENFPYTLRIVSDILESNGSSSMATVCGATLAMMDGGVPIQRPVAGIAMGLIRENGEYYVLTDILGSEDHFGDMDFKVVGTQNGITGFQMDIKIDGVPTEVLVKALAQAHEGRLFILGEMLKGLEKPRDHISPHAPQLELMVVPPEKIGMIIGPGGKIIKKMQEQFAVSIDIDDSGRLTISGSSADGLASTKTMIEGIISEPELGRIYQGTVKAVKDFGCFVEFLPSQEGLVHISELGEGFIDSAADVCSEGDALEVRLIGFDDRGKVKLSVRAASDPEWKPGPPPGRGGGGGSRGGRPPRSDSRDRDRGGRRPPRRD
jgi:polyribonucleotide nucleotidyltransferase